MIEDQILDHHAWLHHRDGKQLNCRHEETKHESFYNKVFNKAVFKDCYFRNVSFSSCNFNGTMFDSCKFYLCTFSHCTFNGATFTGEMDRNTFYYCDWRLAKVKDCLFHHQSIVGSHFDFPIIRMDIYPWAVTVLRHKTMIGCQSCPNSFWLDPCLDAISEMDDRALEWWKANGSIIQAAIRRVS